MITNLSESQEISSAAPSSTPLPAPLFGWQPELSELKEIDPTLSTTNVKSQTYPEALKREKKGQNLQGQIERKEGRQK
eukprot:scaffold264839_cov32-Prasinocladus_malaysianus.AAC.1